MVREQGVRFIDVLDEPAKVIDAIACCEVVISTSLHGIIVAEAYGVPAVWAIAGDRVLGGEFKFRDYYEGTNRAGKPVDWRRRASVAVAVRAACPVGLSQYDGAGLRGAFPYPRESDS